MRLQSPPDSWKTRNNPRSTKILPQNLIQKRKKIPLVESNKVVERGKNDITQKEKQAGAKPTRRYLTRNTATMRIEQERILAAAISVMELSQNPEDLKVHKVLLHQILENLGSEFHDFMMEDIKQKG